MSNSDNKMLPSDIIDEEIPEVMEQIYLWKAPSLDGTNLSSTISIYILNQMCFINRGFVGY